MALPLDTLVTTDGSITTVIDVERARAAAATNDPLQHGPTGVV
jgi:hypothetical protein